MEGASASEPCARMAFPHRFWPRRCALHTLTLGLCRRNYSVISTLLDGRRIAAGAESLHTAATEPASEFCKATTTTARVWPTPTAWVELSTSSVL